MNGFKGRKGLHLVHMNIRSLWSGGKFEIFKEQLAESGISIFTLSETWLKNEIPDHLVEIQGYNLVRWDRSWGDDKNSVKKGGGLAAYIKNSMQVDSHVLQGLNRSTKDIEIQWLKISQQGLRKIVVANIYRPPQGNPQEFCSKLTQFLTTLDLPHNEDLFLMGDFNIDVLDSKLDQVRELKQTATTFGNI